MIVTLALFNEILNKEEQGLEFHTLFKKCVKLKLLDMENEYSLFLKNEKTHAPFFI